MSLVTVNKSSDNYAFVYVHSRKHLRETVQLFTDFQVVNYNRMKHVLVWNKLRVNTVSRIHFKQPQSQASTKTRILPSHSLLWLQFLQKWWQLLLKFSSVWLSHFVSEICPILLYLHGVLLKPPTTDPPTHRPLTTYPRSTDHLPNNPPTAYY